MARRSAGAGLTSHTGHDLYADAVEIRHAEPADYGRVIARVNTWWGGREMAPMLPRLFFVHFEGTSYVIDGDDGQLAAFLIGFLSQTDPDEALDMGTGTGDVGVPQPLVEGQAVVQRLERRRRSPGETTVPELLPGLILSGHRTTS